VSDQILYTRCVRWRAIGDDVRRSFNLTVPDTFLLSMADLTEELRDPAIVINIISHPELVLYTILHSEMAAPVRAFIRSVRVWIAHSISYLIEHSRWIRIQHDAKHDTTDSNTTNSNTTNSSDDSNTTESASKSNHHRLHTTHSLLMEIRRAAPMPHIASVTGQTAYDAYQEEEENDVTDATEDPEKTHQRNLLTFQDMMDDVKTYSTQLALGDGATQLMGGTLSDAFVSIPNTPITSFDLECGPAWTLATLIVDSFKLVGAYFSTMKAAPPHVERDVLLSLPEFGTKYRNPDTNHPPIINPRQNSIAGDIGRSIFENLFGIDPNYVLDVFDGVPDIAKRFMTCDINSVMFCSEFRYSLLSSGIVVATVLYIGGVIFSSIGVPFVWTAIGLIYVPTVLFYSLGYSPLCAPMIPTCIGDEIISMFDTMLPVRVQWPQALQQSANCIDNINITTSECIVSCSAHPFNFRGVSQGTAWVVCELNIDACISAHNWLQTQSFAATPDAILYDLSSALWRSHVVITQADADMVTAYRVCATFTSWRLVPLIILVVICIYTIPVVIMMPLQLMFSGIKMLFDVLSMSHTHLDVSETD
jgi:hypothetical protein